MKKHVLSLLFVITLFSLTVVSASALVNDSLKVGIRWGVYGAGSRQPGKRGRLRLRIRLLR